MEILFSREIRLWENWGKKLATIILNLFPHPRKWTRPMNFSYSVRGIKFYPPLSFRDDTVERIMNEATSSQNRIWSANRITNIPSSHPPPHLVVNQYQCAGCASEKNLRFGHFPRVSPTRREADIRATFEKPLDSFYYLPLVRALSSFASVSLPDRWWYVWRNVIKFFPLKRLSSISRFFFRNCISFSLKYRFE